MAHPSKPGGKDPSLGGMPKGAKRGSTKKKGRKRPGPNRTRGPRLIRPKQEIDSRGAPPDMANQEKLSTREK